MTILTIHDHPQYLDRQQDLKETIGTLAAEVEKGTVINSLANVNIVYALKDAFEIIVTHEETHLGQLKLVLASVHRV